MRVSVLSALILPLFAGCAWLSGVPAGTPPEGAIVENAPTAGEMTRRAAENYLVASLAAYTLQNMPGGAMIAIQADPATRIVAEAVLRNLKPISAITFAPDSPLVLRSRADGNRWIFQLYRLTDQTILWQERLAVRD